MNLAVLQCDHSCDPQRCLTLFLCAACLLHTAAWLQQNLPEMEIVPVRRGNCKYTDRGQTLPRHLLTHINPGELQSFSPFCICANYQGSACTTPTPPAVAEILPPLSQPCSTLGIRKELRQCPLRDPSSCSRVLSMPFTLSRQSQPNSPIPQLCPLLRLERTLHRPTLPCWQYKEILSQTYPPAQRQHKRYSESNGQYSRQQRCQKYSLEASTAGQVSLPDVSLPKLHSDYTSQKQL